MKRLTISSIVGLLLLLVTGWPAMAVVQCPTDNYVAEQAAAEDLDGDGVIDYQDDNVMCMHLTAGDGFTTMADGYPQYIFGFHDVTGLPEDQVMMDGMLGANLPSPTIVVPEGKELYLTVTNVWMVMRPDLFDPHSIHWHGFRQASAFFDGVPEASIAINPGATFTYYYQPHDPGTFLYHCHVEATEHIHMGMVGNLWVTPAQNGDNFGGYTQFAYNDGDGSTGYDIEYPIQLEDFDPAFHDASVGVEPLPFAYLKEKYHMFNGRGYPDTVNPNVIDGTDPDGNVYPARQQINSLITAGVGQRILLRIANLSVSEFHTVQVLGIPMRVVGKDAALLRGPNGADLSYYTNSVTLGGGESIDVILETAGLTAGTYFLYSRNLDDLNNNDQDRGGMMTEIHLTN